MRVKIVAPVAGERGLRVCLATLFGLDRLALQSGRFPRIYDAGVRYQREDPRRREEWRTIPEVLARGEGDCEDLAAWRAAELVASGEDPRARPVLRRTGTGWHVVVARGDGSVEDPSRILGMGKTWKL